MYDLGKNAYLDNHWKDCIIHFENALQAYRNYILVNTKCKRKCKIVPEHDLILQRGNNTAVAVDEELRFFETKVQCDQKQK